MPFDAYVKITGPTVDGESTAKDMEKHIEIYSFSWGAYNPANGSISGQSGRAAGRASVSKFNLTKKTETSSAPLFAACCGGTHYAKVEISLRKATGVDGGQKVFLKYTFEDVMVDSIHWSSSPEADDTPLETISLAFAKVAIDYFKQDGTTGSMFKGSTATYDLTKVSR
jgi:type VI secretion system secreted protein Hcp